MEPKLIVLVTGLCGAGKDHCADAWASVLASYNCKITTRTASISTETKREYAVATSADLQRLLHDRGYKEKHRAALASFFQSQVQQRPRLPEEHFLGVVYGAAGVDVLLITGMRDEAPVAAFSHLVPDSQLIEVRVQVSDEIRMMRRSTSSDSSNESQENPYDVISDRPYRPCLFFENEADGDRAAKEFARRHLIPLVNSQIEGLANSVRSIPNFPRPGVDFRHILGLVGQRDGLGICSARLMGCLPEDRKKVGAVVCCEIGSIAFASVLAHRLQRPLVVIRKSGKLPPPVIAVTKMSSHISASGPDDAGVEMMEMEMDALPDGASVVVVDDVLSTGNTLCAVLRLLEKAGVAPSRISALLIAEFPLHRGRHFLQKNGFDEVHIRSLLVFGGH